MSCQNQKRSQNRTKNYFDVRVFGYENKEKYPIYVSKKCCKAKHVDLLLKGEGENKYYALSYL